GRRLRADRAAAARRALRDHADRHHHVALQPRAPAARPRARRARARGQADHAPEAARGAVGALGLRSNGAKQWHEGGGGPGLRRSLALTTQRFFAGLPRPPPAAASRSCIARCETPSRSLPASRVLRGTAPRSTCARTARSVSRAAFRRWAIAGRASG